MCVNKVFDEGYTVSSFKTGTVGDVTLISGTVAGKPAQRVVKKQKKWERPGDRDSWRREYDLYSADLGWVFSEDFRWPICYDAGIENDETTLWLEYIEGVTGDDLTVDMFEAIAFALGRFQGKIYAMDEFCLIDNLSKPDAMERFYGQNMTNEKIRDYMNSDDCHLPSELCEMMFEIDKRADEVWAEIKKLPLVLCHRDFFPPNIFYVDGCVVVIDWDSAGYGYLGEDLVGLIGEANDLDCMVENFERCVPAYLKGFAEGSGLVFQNAYVYERLVMHMGYMAVNPLTWRGDAKTVEQKKWDLAVMEKIYEMKGKFKENLEVFCNDG